MPLFIVRHQHAADGCPAQDPFMGASLLNHLSRPNVRKFGLQIQGEAVVQGEHTMYLIVDAVDENRLREFMQPFQMAGSLDIYPASTCVRAVASGGCAAPAPASRGRADAGSRRGLPARDRRRHGHAPRAPAQLRDISCGARWRRRDAECALLHAQQLRHAQSRRPGLSARDWRPGRAGAEFHGPRSPEHEVENEVVTLECAGNGRALFDRPTEGEKWGLGAVSTAEWTGVPLVEILDRAGVRQEAKEVLFRGADGGNVESRAESLRFERSLRIDDARDGDVLLAYAMNGEPLPVEHGYPLRLIVPRWYAVASVKWLTEIELIDRTFTGHYQGDKYRYEWERDGCIVSEPVTLQRVRALITEPSPQTEVRARANWPSAASPGPGRRRLRVSR